jgi:coenzyme F420-reducing hydrogenase delta subunit/Pyruvate/2-oxoacid:ferredoxin oxidoreductase delta subunit
MRVLAGLAFRSLSTLDALANRLYGSRFNPLYQSGTIVVFLYVVLVVTGVWLTLFYRVGSPWESVSRVTANLWWGNWVRGLHRYASDAAVIATAVHAWRMFAERRSWGPRTLAWASGVLLVGLLMICGWTGYVMVWDTFGEALAREFARMIDTLPFLSEPISRAFTGEQPMAGTFFFVVLFAHIGLPLFAIVFFWLHVKKLARPALLPPRPLMWAIGGALSAVAIVRPLVMAPKADAFVLPAEVPVDGFFAFWLPLTAALDGGTALGLLAAALLAGLVVPMLTAERGAARPPASTVNEDLCVGCVQCTLDCPYHAIEMVPRVGEGSELVARVDPALCVSCGICAASCAPMGIGPAGRTGRDQVAAIRPFAAGAQVLPDAPVVVIGCEHGAGAFAAALEAEGTRFHPVRCAGNLHTSVIELVLRGGAAGVLVLACPPRDCWHREGPRWLVERAFHGREAELQARVDRRRVRIASASAGERSVAVAALDAFRNALEHLEPPAVTAIRSPEIDATCEPDRTEAPV